MVFRVAGPIAVSPSFVGGKYGAFHYDFTTTLTASINSNSTAPIAVVSTTGFSSSGYLVIDSELIEYTGITATTFTGITRGVAGSNGANHASSSPVGGAQVAVANTSTLLQLNTTDLSNGVTLTASSELQVASAGTYSLIFSIQTFNAGNSPDNLTVWVRVNGVDVPNTASICTTPSIHGGIFGAGIVCVNVFLPLLANDKVQLYWATDSGTSAVVTYPATTSPAHPASPAVIATLQQLS